MIVEFVKELPAGEWAGRACLVRRGEAYFIVSSAPAMGARGEPETLAFPADRSGDILSWAEVAGGSHQSREEVMRELEELDIA